MAVGGAGALCGLDYIGIIYLYWLLLLTLGLLPGGVGFQLGDQIKDARVSHRLADSPACLVSPDDGVTSSMERLMRVMQKDDSIPQKIFEINRDHPLLRTMLKLSKADPDDPQLAEMIQSLFDSTLLLDGYIKDPHALASRATKLLEQASAWYADVKKL